MKEEENIFLKPHSGETSGLDPEPMQYSPGKDTSNVSELNDGHSEPDKTIKGSYSRPGEEEKPPFVSLIAERLLNDGAKTKDCRREVERLDIENQKLSARLKDRKKEHGTLTDNFQALDKRHAQLTSRHNVLEGISWKRDAGRILGGFGIGSIFTIHNNLALVQGISDLFLWGVTAAWGVVSVFLLVFSFNCTDSPKDKKK